LEQGITANLAPYNPVYVTLDYACQYLRAMHTSDIVSSSYDPDTRQVTITLDGETDIPTMFYSFTAQGDDIQQVMVDVPAFSGSTEVVYTLAGPVDHIVITPAFATVVTGGKQQFTALGYDLDENPIPNLPFTWRVVNGGGTIDAGGMFTAGLIDGIYLDSVEASLDGISSYASVEVVVPTLDHFTFEPVGSPQYVDIPFQVTISGRDISGNLFTGFSGQVALSDSTGTIEPVTSGSFSGGVWTGEVRIGQEAPNVTITASEGDVTGTSESFEVSLPHMDYLVTSSTYEHLPGVPFLVTVAANPDTATTSEGMALAAITMSSNSTTMSFDADGDGVFGEVGDNFKLLLGASFDIMARDTTSGTGVTIVATDRQGRFGYNTYTILFASYLPVLFANGPY
jgi:hypothetical protein